MAMGRPPTLTVNPGSDPYYTTKLSPDLKPYQQTSQRLPYQQFADIMTSSHSGETEPWKFGLAIVGLAVVWFLFPKGSHWWLALLLIGGGLVAANKLAEKNGQPSPLRSLGI